MSAPEVKPTSSQNGNGNENAKEVNVSVVAEPAHVKNTTELTAAMKSLKNKTIVVDFFADWCGPCRIIAPKLLEFQQSYPNVAVIKVNVDEAEELAEKYEISVVPTFVAFKGGDKVETLIGSDIGKIEDLFKKYNGNEANKNNNINKK